MVEKHVPNKIRREESSAKIIASAIKNFGAQGYSHSSISQIAHDAGVSPGLITNRYQSKEELFEAAFLSIFQIIIIDPNSYNNAREFLIKEIGVVIDLYDKDSLAFDFFSMIYVSNDKPSAFVNRAKQAFYESKSYFLLKQAQDEGFLQKGDIYNLLNAFLAHAYIQIGICRRYNLDLPSNEYFLSAILSQNIDNEAYYTSQMLNLLLDEYQAAFLIKLEDLSIFAYKYDSNQIAPGSVSKAVEIKDYEKARLWYIENYVVEQSKKQMLEQTDLNYVLYKVSDGQSFFVEYGRIIDGQINYNQISYNRIINRKGDIGYIAMGFRNIDVAKKAEIDDLTGMLTRHAFFVKAEELLKKNPDVQYDLIISDIVDFKKINETYGVKVADEIIKWVSNYIVNKAGPNALIGRYGGDQAVLLATRAFVDEIVSEESGKQYYEAEKNNGLPEIRNKFGVYRNISHDKSIVSTCDKAHMALNSIKRQYDKSIAFYNEDIKSYIDKQRMIESCMHKSMENGDFKVYYQPKHDCKTGALVGAEALVRWVHPDYGFMNPGEFIPLFEQNGFIVANDRYVWRKTCENLSRWKDAGIKTVPISINASKLTLELENVVSRMKNTVDMFNIDANQLHIEITETMMSHNVEDLIKKLDEIRSMGFEVELDDFGSGFSSINVLSTLPIDVLKLDMSFMQQFGDDRRLLVLESCINLAKKLGFKTVSEGVEHKEQKELLNNLDVDIIQGYYYSKPLPEDQFEEYMIKCSKSI